MANVSHAFVELFNSHMFTLSLPMRQNSNWKRWNIINKGAYKAKTVKKRLESYNNFNIWDYCKMIHYGAEIILDIIPQLLSIIF